MLFRSAEYHYELLTGGKSIAKHRIVVDRDTTKIGAFDCRVMRMYSDGKLVMTSHYAVDPKREFLTLVKMDPSPSPIVEPKPPLPTYPLTAKTKNWEWRGTGYSAATVEFTLHEGETIEVPFVPSGKASAYRIEYRVGSQLIQEFVVPGIGLVAGKSSSEGGDSEWRLKSVSLPQ